MARNSRFLVDIIDIFSLVPIHNGHCNWVFQAIGPTEVELTNNLIVWGERSEYSRAVGLFFGFDFILIFITYYIIVRNYILLNLLCTSDCAGAKKQKIQQTVNYFGAYGKNIINVPQNKLARCFPYSSNCAKSARQESGWINTLPYFLVSPSQPYVFNAIFRMDKMVKFSDGYIDHILQIPKGQGQVARRLDWHCTIHPRIEGRTISVQGIPHRHSKKKESWRRLDEIPTKHSLLNFHFLGFVFFWSNKLFVLWMIQEIKFVVPLLFWRMILVHDAPLQMILFDIALRYLQLNCVFMTFFFYEHISNSKKKKATQSIGGLQKWGFNEWWLFDFLKRKCILRFY